MIKKKADELITSVANKEYFTGTAWITPLAAPGGITINAASVTFSPGARNNWHTHPGGQIRYYPVIPSLSWQTRNIGMGQPRIVSLRISRSSAISPARERSIGFSR